jgi:hypothetical protein
MEVQPGCLFSRALLDRPTKVCVWQIGDIEPACRCGPGNGDIDLAKRAIGEPHDPSRAAGLIARKEGHCARRRWGSLRGNLGCSANVGFNDQRGRNCLLQDLVAQPVEILKQRITPHLSLKSSIPYIEPFDPRAKPLKGNRHGSTPRDHVAESSDSSARVGLASKVLKGKFRVL